MLDLAGHQTKGLSSPSPIARRSVLLAFPIEKGPRAAVQFKVIADLAPFAGRKSHTGRNRRLFDLGNLGRFGLNWRAQDLIFDLVLNLVRREWRYDDASPIGCRQGTIGIKTDIKALCGNPVFLGTLNKTGHANELTANETA